MAALNFPTQLHKEAVEIVTNFFVKEIHVDTILLTNSIARGKAMAGSDIDLAVLVKPITQPVEIETLEKKWQDFLQADPTLARYKSSHRFAQIHLDIINGNYKPALWEDGEGPDFFEVEIGNHLVYSAPLAGKGDYFRELQEQWLPFYNASLRSERLKMAKAACLHDLDYVPFLVKRNLHFHAFDKLYKAFHEFLQALFIRHMTYPIAYNKWIKEQFHEILQLPELYKKLPQIISVHNIESDELIAKGKILHQLLEKYC
jgi:predicted nucleotidyltransferase